jgi:hypothetical protein
MEAAVSTRREDMLSTLLLILAALFLLMMAVVFDVFLGQALLSALRGKDLPRRRTLCESRRYGTSRDTMRCS